MRTVFLKIVQSDPLFGVIPCGFEFTQQESRRPGGMSRLEDIVRIRFQIGEDEELIGQVERGLQLTRNSILHP